MPEYYTVEDDYQDYTEAKDTLFTKIVKNTVPIALLAGAAVFIGAFINENYKESNKQKEVSNKIEKIAEDSNKDTDFTIKTGKDIEITPYNAAQYSTAKEMKSALGDRSLIGQFSAINKTNSSIEKGYFIYTLQEDEKGKETTSPDRIVFVKDVLKTGASVIR